MLTPENVQNGIFARHSHVPGCCTSLAGGSYNEREAYLYFSRASLEYLAVAGRSPNVIHLHEWQAAGATSNNPFSRSAITASIASGLDVQMCTVLTSQQCM